MERLPFHSVDRYKGGVWLDFGSRRVRLYPAPVEDYARWLTELGCRVDRPVDLMEGVSPGDWSENTPC